MKTPIIIFSICLGLAGGAIAARASLGTKQSHEYNYPHYSYSWSEFARAMENIR